MCPEFFQEIDLIEVFGILVERGITESESKNEEDEDLNVEKKTKATFLIIAE